MDPSRKHSSSLPSEGMHINISLCVYVILPYFNMINKKFLFIIQDKNKIRHKKRWSQCMYFYYFLGYQLEARDDLSQAQKDARAMNTYCLALGKKHFNRCTI